MRSDTKRNISRLLEAVAEEVSENAGSLSLQGVAARAEVGVASAYRYFPSVDALLEAYMLKISAELRDFSKDCQLGGVELYDAVLARWVDLVLEHGAVLVQLRSKTGYLQRLLAQEPVMEVSRAIWERPLKALLGESGLTPDALVQALFLNNALSDPREILELHSVESLTRQQIPGRLRASLIGALFGTANLRSWQHKTSATPALSTWEMKSNGILEY
ncbi:TetR family transcriptional regulator [Arthrobacter sp. StoSoilA2]|uniref:TetR/AcrR family transcriptional regulator n=1 Tax=Arthrobacter sp. StoSoilA2 TaxID=2830990 RepID=UPI001CC5AF1D|nr:TetR/AcrR family transcriptional regulator [Arthrobacter sp. StoSoilA2]BCW36026.1 TetR family transcriptional regulator [Arthrobacter sp. StoSoilA2]